MKYINYLKPQVANVNKAVDRNVNARVDTLGCVGWVNRIVESCQTNE